MEAFLKGGSLKVVKSSSKQEEKTPHVPRKQGPIPWVEKYRPRTVNDVAYQDEVVSMLKKTLEGSDLPNLLFYGPPGTGKTSTILALAREMFGDVYKSRILELNASDERGIQVIRDKVKNFAQQTVAMGTKSVDGKPIPPFKIVILDEADSMTHNAQAALRRTMEKETRSTRFCLICNYISRIIEPLTSRCSKFRFKPLSTSILLDRLKYIAEQEGVHYEIEVLEKLVELSEGDLRRAITLLQSSHRLNPDRAIGPEELADVSGVVPKKWLDEFHFVCKTNSYNKLESYLNDLTCEGYSASQFISQYHDEIVTSDQLTDPQKSVICEKLAICEHRLLDGADELLQLLDLGCVVMQQLCRPPSSL